MFKFLDHNQTLNKGVYYNKNLVDEFLCRQTGSSLDGHENTVLKQTFVNLAEFACTNEAFMGETLGGLSKFLHFKPS